MEFYGEQAVLVIVALKFTGLHVGTVGDGIFGTLGSSSLLVFERLLGASPLQVSLQALQ